MGKKFEWKWICRKIWKKRHTLWAVIVDNPCVYYEISEENKGEESKCNGFENSNIDKFYNLYRSKLPLKDRREKLQSREVVILEGSFKVFQEEEWAYCDYELEKSHLRVKEFLKAQKIGKLHQY
jgi:hypothetical protein